MSDQLQGVLVMPLQQRISERSDELTPAERKAAEYMRDHPFDVVFASASAIGAIAGTSDATVIRAARTLGYSGLPELRHALAAALAAVTRPSAMLHQRIATLDHDPAGLLDRVFEEASDALAETRRCVSADAFQSAVTLLAEARECVAFGIGLSETVAEYLSRRLTRLGIRARTAQRMGFDLAEGLLPLAAGDVIALFAPGRLVREIEVLIEHAERVGASVILITDALAPVLGERAAVTLPAVFAPGGTPGETLAATVLVDALVLAIAAANEDRAVDASELLNQLRAAILR